MPSDGRLVIGNGSQPRPAAGPWLGNRSLLSSVRGSGRLLVEIAGEQGSSGVPGTPDSNALALALGLGDSATSNPPVGGGSSNNGSLASQVTPAQNGGPSDPSDPSNPSDPKKSVSSDELEVVKVVSKTEYLVATLLGAIFLVGSFFRVSWEGIRHTFASLFSLA